MSICGIDYVQAMDTSIFSLQSQLINRSIQWDAQSVIVCMDQVCNNDVGTNIVNESITGAGIGASQPGCERR